MTFRADSAESQKCEAIASSISNIGIPLARLGFASRPVLGFQRIEDGDRFLGHDASGCNVNEVRFAAELGLVGVFFASVATIASADSRPAPTAGPNVLFILIDTLRADHLSTYGYERETSPTLDWLASVGVRFDKVRSQASWTKPSMASLWTSLHPSSTGVLRFSHGLPDEATLPAEILDAAGYRTGGLWRNGWVAPNFGFGQGFDLYVRPPAGAAARRRTMGAQTRPFPTDADLTESARQFPAHLS